MSQRRMFSPEIVESDAFLDMPISSQALYFHLGMYADDDGFVNPKKIMRMMGTSEDDLKVLIGKRFLLSFISGVVVVKHWKINNLVRKDWYRPTQYIEEKNILLTKENGSYTELNANVNEKLTVRQQNVHVGKDSIGKERVGKVSKGEVNLQPEVAVIKEPKEIQELMNILYEINPTLNFGNITQRSAASRLIKRLGVDKALGSARAAVGVHGKPYAPTITTPLQLENKLSELVAFYKKNQSKVLII